MAKVVDRLKQLLGFLPSRPAAPKTTKVITVRMPEGMHRALKQEAWERHMSMNELAVAKLRITNEMVHVFLHEVGSHPQRG
jgi:predicted HicB family RNase H-like nuclease